MRLSAWIIAAVVASLFCAGAASTAAPQSTPQVQLTFAPVVKRVAPAVVNVYSQSVVQTAVNPLFSDPMFQRFFGATPELRQRVQQSLGSGVIVRPDGIIVTNNHVVQGGQNIVVALSDRREFKARVLLADSRTDLAVIKIDTKGERLPVIELGDSDRLSVGDIVLAEFEGNSREGEVVGIDREERKVDVKTTVQDFWYDPEHLNAIPLDEGQLLQFGFERQEMPDGKIKYLKGPFRILLSGKGDFSNFEIWYREDRRHISQPLSVHVLQNHYHSMTKVDLTRPVGVSVH